MAVAGFEKELSFTMELGAMKRIMESDEWNFEEQTHVVRDSKGI